MSRPDIGKLTPAELAVVELKVDRLPYKEIGERLGITTNTVKSHLVSARDKWSVRSNPELVAAYHAEMAQRALDGGRYISGTWSVAFLHEGEPNKACDEVVSHYELAPAGSADGAFVGKALMVGGCVHFERKEQANGRCELHVSGMDHNTWPTDIMLVLATTSIRVYPLEHFFDRRARVEWIDVVGRLLGTAAFIDYSSARANYLSGRLERYVTNRLDAVFFPEIRVSMVATQAPIEPYSQLDRQHNDQETRVVCPEGLHDALRLSVNHARSVDYAVNTIRNPKDSLE